MGFYREFKCVECGMDAIDTSPNGRAKYCGPNCNKKAYLRRKGKLKETEIVILCKYNPGVACDAQVCYGCGWHPDVEKKRKEKLV